MTQEEKQRNISWLLESTDPALLHQTHCDLLHTPVEEYRKLQEATLETGWIMELLQRQLPDGTWSHDVYNPKWTCAHYVLYELIQLGVPDHPEKLRLAARQLLSYPLGADGGINYAHTVRYSDVCINGMILSINAHFKTEPSLLKPVLDFLMKTIMPDGGWNCAYLQDAVHSSLHTTISVLEGLLAYRGSIGADSPTINLAIEKGLEFILMHQLYLSDHTGEVIKDEFFRFPFPVRWKYDILRCLDLFQRYRIPYDPRMRLALDRIEASRLKSGRWRAVSQPGKTFFIVEKNGVESRWNTLRAMRVLDYYH
ncbi:MAG: hypothetical protein CVV52_00550 [Spirochaetae bacterium HGW-Spirochaetae-8]|nr:MAG: hypothetical protein CVV52_00550 [Spirochaetae bacterium HGW-Spirochaetae-8]